MHTNHVRNDEHFDDDVNIAVVAIVVVVVVDDDDDDESPIDVVLWTGFDVDVVASATIAGSDASRCSKPIDYQCILSI
jgi:hypothetical protein